MFKQASGHKDPVFAASAFGPMAIGNVNTEYHGVGLVVQSAVPIGETTQPESRVETSPIEALHHESLEDFIHRQAVPPLPGASIYSQGADTQALLDKLERPLENAMTSLNLEDDVDCPCEFGDSTGDLIKCNECENLVHTACHGFETTKDAPTEFYCLTCRKDRASRGIGNAEDAFLDDRLLQALCFNRRFLHFCKQNKEFTTKILREHFKTSLYYVKRAVHALLEKGAIVQKKDTGQNRCHIYVLSPDKTKYEYYMSDKCLVEVLPKAKVVLDSEMETQSPPTNVASESPNLISDDDIKVSVPAVSVSRKRAHDSEDQPRKKASVPKRKLT
jgi:hypothetical protein